ncbi:uncharacterized protein LOC116201706 [Punica granatum]|uniref:Pierisin-like domain-containing protein n=2 Tax=Punica granatum TaxID=22663 RepID=A0A218WVR3_PUNGR|nr:uncharacterized protein LOC116201706 [Punica granatum]OWM76578.1 hypothetical protein CDL15_Pgr005542 [Punica granatum]PKI43956.1 hypothetical protein CRG98_035632 [Punica granatum]
MENTYINSWSVSQSVICSFDPRNSIINMSKDDHAESILPNTTARGCASGFTQPVTTQDMRKALDLVYTVYYINCVSREGPRVPQIVYRNSTEERDIARRVFMFYVGTNGRDFLMNGFHVRPQGNTPDEVYYNLFDYIYSAGAPVDPNEVTPRAFLSATLSPSLHNLMGDLPIGTMVCRYEIYAPGGILVRETLGDRLGFRNQRDQIAFVGGISPRYIRGYQLFTVRGESSPGHPRLERADENFRLSQSFNLQTHPPGNITIENPSYYYINSYNERKQLQLLSGIYQPPGPGDQDPWYKHDVLNRVSYVNAAFRAYTTNNAYLFMRDECVLVNYAPGSRGSTPTDVHIEDGPLLICDRFPALRNTAFGEHGIDCAFADHFKTEAYIFSSNMCALIDYAPGGTSTSNNWIMSGPMTIVSMFPFFKGTPFEDGVDAAFEATAVNEAYLFRGDKYVLINYYGSTAQIIDRIKPIADKFGGLTGTIFEHGIEAAFASHRRNKAYIFKGDSYALIDFATGSIDDSLKKILQDWPSFYNILPRRNRGLDIHDHDHHEHGNGGDHGHVELRNITISPYSSLGSGITGSSAASLEKMRRQVDELNATANDE